MFLIFFSDFSAKQFFRAQRQNCVRVGCARVARVVEKSTRTIQILLSRGTADEIDSAKDFFSSKVYCIIVVITYEC